MNPIAGSGVSSALPLAQAEKTTPLWFALKLGPAEFGIFDAFADLLEQVELLAVKGG